MIFHPVFPLKPHSLSLVKAQPPERLSVVGRGRICCWCRRPCEQSHHTCQGRRRRWPLLSEEAARRVWRPCSPQHLHCLRHGHVRGGRQADELLNAQPAAPHGAEGAPHASGPVVLVRAGCSRWHITTARTESESQAAQHG